MGFTPAEIDRMSLWEFLACSEGYAAAHGGEKQSGHVGDIDDERLRAMGVEGF